MVEEHIAKVYHNEQMRCPVHLSIGQEANAVAICNTLTKDDYMVSTHRGHAHYLAKGGSLVGLIGELYGKKNGCSGGHGGSMHLVDRSCGFLGSTSIVGGTIPIGVGAAWSAKLKKENRVSVVCIGDAAVEEGVFHEAANFAALHKLKVVFFVEDNKYSCYTHKKHRQPKRLWGDIANCYNTQFHYVSGLNYWDDITSMSAIINEMRHKDTGPILVACDTYRFIEHCGPNQDDNLGYRDRAEVIINRSRDPIECLEHDLIMAQFLNDNMYVNIKFEIQSEINDVFVTVDKAHNPTTLGEFTYAT